MKPIRNKLILCLAFATTLHAAEVPVKNLRVTGASALDSGTFSLSGGTFTSGTGATVNLASGSVTLPSDVTRLGTQIDLSGTTETSGTLTWARVDKAGSSLADFATRSAGDLTSGTVAVARLPLLVGSSGTGAGTAGIVPAPPAGSGTSNHVLLASGTFGQITVSGSNAGATGEGIYLSSTNGVLSFKKLVAGSNVTITGSTDTITIASSGTGGGGGSGAVLQIVEFTNTSAVGPISANTVGSTFAYTDGAQVVSGTFTPISSSSKLFIRGRASLSRTSANGNIYLGLFSGTAAAVAASCSSMGAAWVEEMTVSYLYASPGTSPIVYSLRAETATNTWSSNVLFTGMPAATITVMEVSP